MSEGTPNSQSEAAGRTGQIKHRPDRIPTPAERRAERAVLLPLVGDVGTNSLLLIVGILSGSLALFSEAIRAWLMFAAGLFGLIFIRLVHRGRMAHYEFGVGKIERFVSLVIGLGLVISALLIARTVFLSAVESAPAATPLGLAIAAIINAVNAVVNVVGWWGMQINAPASPSEAYRAQRHARFTMMVSSLLLQVTLTAAALAKDPVVAGLLDIAGATIVVVLMAIRGARMIREAMPHLLDAPLEAADRERIWRACADVIGAGRVRLLRTRCAGNAAEIEVVVDTDDMTSPAAFGSWARTLESHLAEEGMMAFVAIVPDHRAGAAPAAGTTS